MTRWIRRHAGISALVALFAAGSVLAAGAANASPPRHPAFGRQDASLPISITPAGFTIPGPDTRPAGPATLQVQTSVPVGSYFYTFRLNGDTTIADVEEWSAEINSTNPAIEHQAALNLYAGVDYTGGLIVNPGDPAAITIGLQPGTYYFFTTPGFSGATNNSAIKNGQLADLAATAAATPSDLNSLTVTGWNGWARHDRSALRAAEWSPLNGLINVAIVNGQPAYQILPGSLPGDGNFLIHNGNTYPIQAIFRQVVPGTTDASLQDYFNALVAGTTPPPNPLTTSPGGILNLSPGNWALVHLDYPAADYAVLSFLEDPVTNIHAAYEGLHKIVAMH